MKNELKKNLTYNRIMLILSVSCITSGLLSFFLGELVIPISSALLASIILFEDKSKRCFSYTSALSLLCINVFAIFLQYQIISVWSIITILSAIIISRAYLQSSKKAECAFLLTVLTTIILLVPLILSPMFASGEFTLSAAVSFYENLLSDMREEFIVYVDQIVNELSADGTLGTFDAKYFINYYDYQMSMIISYVIIAAFVLVGVTFKCFGIIVKRCAQNDSHIIGWRFYTDNIFAYAYFILAIASLFITTPDSVFAVTILNLYNVFMFIYFYVGYKVAREFFSRGKRSVFSRLLLILGIVMFSNYAIELLAVIGAFSTIKTNNQTPIPEN